MKLPFVPDPQKYAGLFAFDFGEWVSIGYTAEEIRILLAAPEYASGQAYRIHRVDENGRFELAGVRERDLAGEDMMIFARTDADRAADDFRDLRKMAAANPPPATIRVELVDLPDLDPPHAVCLLYPRYASAAISGWLMDGGFVGGDIALGGQEVLALHHRAGATPVASVNIAGASGYDSRTREEVLQSIREMVQR